jgi:hypothetical protein
MPRPNNRFGKTEGVGAMRRNLKGGIVFVDALCEKAGWMKCNVTIVGTGCVWCWGSDERMSKAQVASLEL